MGSGKADIADMNNTPHVPLRQMFLESLSYFFFAGPGPLLCDLELIVAPQQRIGPLWSYGRWDDQTVG